MSNVMANDKVRVLIIDDDREDFELTRKVFKKIEHTQYEVEWIAEYDAGLEALRNGKHDVYLIDLRLGADSGIDLLREGIAAGCKQPMIMLTGLGDHTVDLQAMEIGAADYLSKNSLSAEVLERSVRYAINHCRTLEQLRHAKGIAEEATRLKDKFVALVSHDLKGPLYGLYSLLLMADKEAAGLKSDAMASYVAIARDYTRKMMALADELLKVERFKAGRIQLNSELVYVHELVDEIIARLLPDASRKQVSISSKIPQDMVIIADRILVGEVFYNLISNAIKFSLQGGLITCFAPEGMPSTMAVADSGVGIPEQIISKLFSYENKTSTIGTAGEAGTGFGLPLSYEIMKAHGGDLRVESEEGKGSVFYVVLARPL